MMNIEIRQPRLEALLQQHMVSGRFANVEDALLQALESASVTTAPDSSTPAENPAIRTSSGFGHDLVEVLKQAREFAVDLV